MPDRYSGKVAVITGATRGIGRLITEYFLAEGAAVHGIARSEATINHETYTHHAGVDIADEGAVRDAFRSIRLTHRSINILINNAGAVASQHSLLLPVSEASEVVRTNVMGAYCASREAAKLMRKSGGRIITIGSMAAALEPAGDSIYAASKVASETLMNVMAKEFQSWGITCNTVGVTAIKTGMFHGFSEEVLDGVIAGLPIPRYATEKDIFNVIDFFASDDSDYITAQTVYLGGVH
ncbi:MAG: SDR family oxidoreductase [Acidimicrobiia bacterium]|nr:SDR family oxidoreductase [Acidimicrobiia bacterium]